MTVTVILYYFKILHYHRTFLNHILEIFFAFSSIVLLLYVTLYSVFNTFAQLVRWIISVGSLILGPVPAQIWVVKDPPIARPGTRST